MDSEAKILLDDAIEFCRRDGQDTRLVNMLAQSRALDFTEDMLTIEAPSRFAIAYLERNRILIEEYLQQIAFAPIGLTVLAPEPYGEPADTPATPAQPTQPDAERATAALTEASPTEASPAPAASPAPTAAPAAQAPAQGAVFHPDGGQNSVAAAAAPHTGIKVKNMLSKEEYMRLVGKSADGAAASTGGTQPTTPAPAEPLPPHEPINSKFTFATFVYGDENKHAYHSAQRFAAFADEPGQCNSLFIYGGSGLGKTHLLMAIKNYLAENKPHIRVKYANSQAYIDDFINEIARQKTEGRTILREYHEANVLIIDDIQNIIGKQASIEYFFSLMDEFIRENKKIVIASDRAPKNLGMDERLTSRFNAGMLCLVSEPGFEMKYAILRRYYETIIRGGSAELALDVDTSLLGAFQSGVGKITDEQLRHMAEIGGNNIRELESFCERCASLSFECEQAGREFTAEDIEKVADEYFDMAHKVIHIDTVQSVVEEFYRVSHEELVGPKRSRDIAWARHVAVYLTNSMCDMSSSAIGAEFGGRDHSTVINSLKVVENKIKEDRHICEDLQKLRNKITLRS